MSEFYATIRGDQLLWDEGEFDALNDWLAIAKDGHYAVRFVQKPKKGVPRSQKYIKGCNYLFGVVYKIIQDETGQDKDSVHNEMKQLFLKKLIEVDVKDDTIVFEVVRSLQHEGGDVSDEELWDYIAQVRHFAYHTLSISTPDPDGSTRR